MTSNLRVPSDPALGKAPHDHRDYRPLVWEQFLALRTWAQRVANEFGAGVYLVGSILEKQWPRDVDVAVVWPATEFARRFGPIPATGGTEEMREYVVRVRGSGPYAMAMMHANIAVQEVAGPLPVRVDVHFCPDTWYPLCDRLLLAAPQ